MPSESLSYTYTSETDIDTLLSVVGHDTRLDDDGYGAPDSTESGYRTTIIAWATGRCNFYLLSKYAASELSESWIVNDWCTIVAAYMISCRRGNPPSGALKEMYDQAIEDMKLIQRGEVVLPDTALRNAGWPAWSNITIESSQRLRKARVQRRLSESRSGGVDYDQAVSRHADYGGGSYD